MDPVALIAFWAALFLVTHLGVSSSAIRPRLVATVGESPYRGIYSLIGFATLVPLVIVFFRNKHAGPLLWDLRNVAPVRWLVWVMMLAAFILLVASLINPSPGAMGAPENASGARGLLKVTRHPSFVALSIFGLAHMLMNGFAGDVIFFAIFPAVGILGGLHQDRRKLGEIGDKLSQVPGGDFVLSRRGDPERAPAMDRGRYAVGNYLGRCRGHRIDSRAASDDLRRQSAGMTFGRLHLDLQSPDALKK